MTKTFAIAALLAATAFTPALALDSPHESRQFAERTTAAEPTPMRAQLQFAQNDRQDRGPRAQGRGDGGQGRAQAPAVQARPPAAQAPQQAARVQQRWNRGDIGGNPNWPTHVRSDGGVLVQNGQQSWSRPAPPVNVAPAQAQYQRNWQASQNRRDNWRNNNGNGGVVAHRQDDRSWNGNGRNESWHNDGRNDRRSNWQNQYRDFNRNWSRDWRRDDRYDWQRYRYSNRYLFQAERYYAPYGWDYGYRRFSIGYTLSTLLFDQQYWIDDPYSYRLPPVYGPYRWVRYYDDVLLVDLRSGRVVDKIYDFFD